MKTRRLVLKIPMSFELLPAELVASYVRSGLVIVGRGPRKDMPFRARLHANEDGPEFDGQTLEVAVSAAWAYGVHHTGETEDAAVCDGMLDMAEALASKPGAEVAAIYDTAMETITGAGLAVPHVDAARWPLLACEDERREVAALPH